MLQCRNWRDELDVVPQKGFSTSFQQRTTEQFHDIPFLCARFPAATSLSTTRSLLLRRQRKTCRVTRRWLLDQNAGHSCPKSGQKVRKSIRTLGLPAHSRSWQPQAHGQVQEYGVYVYNLPFDIFETDMEYLSSSFGTASSSRILDGGR